MENIKILIVEDEKTLSNIITDYLKDKGFDTDSAHTGEEGINLLLKKKYNACIIDLRLPDMTGGDFIIKANGIQSNIEFIIHTGSLDYKIPGELEAIGMDGNSILFKPVFDLEIFYDKIIEMLKKSRSK